MVLETERLVLREFSLDDLEDLHRIFGDPLNRKYFPDEGASKERCQKIIERMIKCYAEIGYGFWAPVLKENQEMIGLIGINKFEYDVPFDPKIEVGWTVDHKYAGKGLATEAARGCLQYGFETLGMDEITAITTPTNTPSRRVMEKLGMTFDPSVNFWHPKVDKDNPLGETILYRIKKHEAAVWA